MAERGKTMAVDDQKFDVSTEMKTTLMCEPMLMGFSHIMKHRKADEAREGKGIIACTDGTTVWYGTAYAALPASQRAYVHVHELMHGIFMHSDRAQLVRLVKGTINPAIFNYAADSIINEGIDANSAMPSGLFDAPVEFPPVRMKMIHEAMAEAIKFSGATPPSTYDAKALKGLQVELIYDWLMWGLDAVMRKRKELEKDCPRAKQTAEDEKQKTPAKPAEEAGDDTSDDADDRDQAEQAGDEAGEDGDDNGDDDGNGDGDGDGETGADDEGSEGRPGEGGACDPAGKPSKLPCTCGRCEGEGEGEGGGQPGQGSGGTMIERMAGSDAWDLEEQLERMRELLDKGTTTTEMIDVINGRMEDARIRIEQIVQGQKMQGRGQGSLLMELAADMPKAVVPWNRILRRVTTRGLGTKLNDSYVRYGSSTMTALARGESAVPYSPGTTIFTERPRILVVVDVSGSHVGMLPHCFSEIWSIAKMKGAVVEVMTFDDGVQEVIEIRSRQDFVRILKTGIKGGGGTFLGDVWRRIDKLRDPYRMCVVMTDGYLHAGDKPKIPVVWLVTHGGSDEFATYGEVIHLPEAMGIAA